MHSVLDNIHYAWYFEWPPYHTTSTTSPNGNTIHYMDLIEGYGLSENKIYYNIKILAYWEVYTADWDSTNLQPSLKLVSQEVGNYFRTTFNMTVENCYQTNND